MNRSYEIRRRRLAYGISGFIAGFGVAVLIRWLLGGGFAAMEAVEIGAAGSALLLAFGQRFRRLPTPDDLAVVRVREEMSPLDLLPEHRIPKALRSQTERRIKP